MRTLKAYVPRINGDLSYLIHSLLCLRFGFISLETGGVPLLKEFHSSTGSLSGAFGEMESFLGRYIASVFSLF